MRLDSAYLDRAATETGFQVEPLEKALHLLDLLEALWSHPFLKERLALKGGAALNLFLSELPRLSVDLDLNVIGAAERETMLAERPGVEEAVRAVCARQGLTVRRVPEDHAGGKWRLAYERAAGGTGTIELDLNFLLRRPLWLPARRNSISIAQTSARGIVVLDEHELAGGKLAALFGREASRDLFDAHGLFCRGGLDAKKLRLAFVVYGAMNRRDWRSISPDDVDMDPRDASVRLVPLLRAGATPAREGIDRWCAAMVAELREWLGALLPFTPEEREFLDRINGNGEIAPELLTGDASMQERIRANPALAWKAMNVRGHFGAGGGGAAAADV